jgi:hypothetical protein
MSCFLHDISYIRQAERAGLKRSLFFMPESLYIAFLPSIFGSALISAENVQMFGPELGVLSVGICDFLVSQGFSILSCSEQEKALIKISMGCVLAINENTSGHVLHDIYLAKVLNISYYKFAT